MKSEVMLLPSILYIALNVFLVKSLFVVGVLYFCDGFFDLVVSEASIFDSVSA